MRHVDRIIIHCSATPANWRAGQPFENRVAEIKRWHVQDNGWRDIGYHYIMDRDGRTIAGRPIEQTGAHTRGQNKGSIGICIMGGANSSADDQFLDNFTETQDRALRELIAQLKAKYPKITRVEGHNQHANKACPGFRVAPWLAVGATAPTPLPKPVSPVVTQPELPEEVVALIKETDGEKSQTDMFNQVVQWVTGGGLLAALPNIKSILADVDPIIVVALIFAAVAVFGVATYTRSSRKRKGGKATRALMALKAKGFDV